MNDGPEVLPLAPDLIERVIDAAGRGEVFVIAKGGENVAVVVGIEEYETLLGAMAECVGYEPDEVSA